MDMDRCSEKIQAELKRTVGGCATASVRSETATRQAIAVTAREVPVLAIVRMRAAWGRLIARSVAAPRAKLVRLSDPRRVQPGNILPHRLRTYAGKSKLMPSLDNCNP